LNNVFYNDDDRLDQLMNEDENILNDQDDILMQNDNIEDEVAMIQQQSK